MTTENFGLRLDNFTMKLADSLSQTIYMAKVFRYEFVTPELWLYNIILQPEIIEYCKKMNIDHEALKNELDRYNISQDTIAPDKDYNYTISSQFLNLIAKINNYIDFRESTRRLSDNGSNSYFELISVCDIIINMFSLEETVAQYVLTKYFGNFRMQMIKGLLNEYWNDISESLRIKNSTNSDIHKNTKEGKDNKEEEWNDEPHGIKIENSQVHTPLGNLSIADLLGDDNEPWREYVTNISEKYLFRKPLIGRDKEIERAIRVMCRMDNHNPIFIGEPGVGKTALIYGLAHYIDDKLTPDKFGFSTIYALDISAIMAGANLHGEFERRMKLVLEGVSAKCNCILFIDDIHQLVETGGNNNTINAAELVKPYLDDNRIRIIGSTTYADYNRTIAKKKAFARRFALIDIKEPGIDETIEIINNLLPLYEEYHKVKYSEEAVRYAVEKSNALIHDRFLPDKAINIIDEAGAYRKQNPLFNKKGGKRQRRFQVIDKELINKVLTELCRIDANVLANDTNDGLKELDKRMRAVIYGQDNAIRQVVRAVMMSKAGLTEPDKPIASLLFVGPTGVGKTEVCKVLAKELGIQLVRFDMSEYAEKHTVSKLIGSPAGYVGYDDGGMLTDAVRKSPNCVLLLDEIEKAHTDIYNILLQVMDYANLTDNKGNKADFRNVIIVMTSNAGAQYAGQAAIGFSGGESKGQAMLNTVRKTFKPEFLNRLSGTVVFNDMDITMASRILDKKLNQLASRLKSRQVNITLNDEARKLLLSKGFTTQYGAREMDRAINQFLTPLLMDEILFGKLAKGGTATVGVKDNELDIDTEKSK